MSFFIFISLIIFLTILYYKNNFSSNQLENIKNFIKTNSLNKHSSIMCSFHSTLFFSELPFDVYKNDDIIILIRNYGTNHLIQKKYAENYLIFLNNKSTFKNTSKEMFLNYIEVTQLEESNGTISLIGDLYSKSILQKTFEFTNTIKIQIYGIGLR